MERNIEALAERRQREAQRASLSDKIAQWISRFAGSMTFVAVHAVLVAGWVVINLGWTGLDPFDPSFVILATAASVEAIFLSTFILISQNRAALAADRRADLHLQTSLLAEHEVTQLVRLTAQIAERVGVEGAHAPEVREAQRTVAPEAVLERIEEINEEGSPLPRIR